jgi:excisionase family DNA binding protein
MENGDKLLSLKEAADLVNRTWRTVYRWTLEGKLPYLQPSPYGHIQIKKRDLLEFLEKNF